MSFSFSGALEGLGEEWGSSDSDLDLSGGGSGIPPDAQKILDTLGAHIAVLDRSGRIVAVNRAWSRFADENGGLPEHTGVGDELPRRLPASRRAATSRTPGSRSPACSPYSTVRSPSSTWSILVIRRRNGAGFCSTPRR